MIISHEVVDVKHLSESGEVDNLNIGGIHPGVECTSDVLLIVFPTRTSKNYDGFLITIGLTCVLETHLLVRNLLLSSTSTVLLFPADDGVTVDNQVGIVCTTSGAETNVNLLVNVITCNLKDMQAKVFKLLAG